MSEAIPARHSLARGFEPIGLDSLERAEVFVSSPGRLWKSSTLTDFEKGVTRVLDKYRPAAVVHFAAYAYVGESVAKPLHYYRNNVAGKHDTAGSRSRPQASAISSFRAAARPMALPHPCPIDGRPYAETGQPIRVKKLMVERMLRDLLTRHLASRSVCLRYFNAAGADPESEIGECHRAGNACNTACDSHGPGRAGKHLKSTERTIRRRMALPSRLRARDRPCQRPCPRTGVLAGWRSGVRC